MEKYKVCIKGDNFRIKTDKKVKKKSFHAARFLQARDPADAFK